MEMNNNQQHGQRLPRNPKAEAVRTIVSLSVKYIIALSIVLGASVIIPAIAIHNDAVDALNVFVVALLIVVNLFALFVIIEMSKEVFRLIKVQINKFNEY